MSFFDETDEPPTESRTATRISQRPVTRGTPRRRRPSGPGGGRPPHDQQSIQVRRAIALGAIVVVIILLAVLVNSCESSQRTNALKDYNNNVSSLISQSDSTGHNVFTVLSAGGGSGSGQQIENQINQARVSAQSQLDQAKKLSVPSEVKTANQHLVLAMQMRLDGITNIAAQIQPALGQSANKDAINSLAAEMARFYASDVLYKSYTAPEIAGALHGAGIQIGGANGETINGGQFLPDIQWLNPSFIAGELHVAVPGVAPGKVTPGLHGHELNSVSVAGTTLQGNATNTIPAKPAPTFTLHFTNDGTNTESDVMCEVTVTGTSASGKAVVPQTTAGQSTTCNVTLSSPPAAGTYTVKATVEKVLGEKNLNNNSLSFPVTFQ
ncbi:MAG: CARDB domain-containing protein [Solirubrobacteraceae bacterium]